MDQLEHVLTGPAYNRNRLLIIARTNATTAFNQGRLEMFNQAADFVLYVEFLAILDSRTTDICEARNGKIFRTGGADVAANTPPLHYRCRSFLSPVTTYDLEDMQKAGWKDPDGNTLQQKMDLGGMPELPKGFGNVGAKVSEGATSSPQSQPGASMPSNTSSYRAKKARPTKAERELIDNVEGEMTTGVYTPQEAQKVGKILREEVESRASKVKEELLKTNEMHVDIDKRVTDWFVKERQ